MRYDNFMMSANLNVVLFGETDKKDWKKKQSQNQLRFFHYVYSLHMHVGDIF